MTIQRIFVEKMEDQPQPIAMIESPQISIPVIQNVAPFGKNYFLKNNF